MATKSASAAYFYFSFTFLQETINQNAKLIAKLKLANRHMK